MALEQIGPIVPGIPLAALDSISDPNTRDVLRALVSTHHVRNSQAGSGDESFITARQALIIASTAASAAAASTFIPARYVRGVGDTSVYSGGVESIARGTITLTLAASTRFVATMVWQSLPVSGSYDTRVRLHLDGAQVFDQGNSGLNGKTMSHITETPLTIDAGTHALSIHFANNNSGGSFVLGQWALLLLPIG